MAKSLEGIVLAGSADPGGLLHVGRWQYTDGPFNYYLGRIERVASGDRDELMWLLNDSVLRAQCMAACIRPENVSCYNMLKDLPYYMLVSAKAVRGSKTLLAYQHPGLPYDLLHEQTCLLEQYTGRRGPEVRARVDAIKGEMAELWRTAIQAEAAMERDLANANAESDAAALARAEAFRTEQAALLERYAGHEQLPRF